MMEGKYIGPYREEDHTDKVEPPSHTHEGQYHFGAGMRVPTETPAKLKDPSLEEGVSSCEPLVKDGRDHRY